MALITSRISVVRGCPPGLAGGIRGSRILHSLSLTSLGELLRCIFPPLLFPFSLLGYFFLCYSSSIVSPGRRPCRAALQARALALSSFIWLPKPLHTAS